MKNDPEIPGLQALAVALAATFFSQGMAHAIGSWFAILIGWIVGFGAGLYRLPPTRTGAQVAIFAFVSLGAVVGLTVPLSYGLASIVSHFVPWFTAADAKSWLFPVAAAIPAIGHSWADVAAFLWERLKELWPFRRRSEEPKP